MKQSVLYVIAGIVVVAAIAGGILWWRQRTAQPTEGTRSAVVERGELLVAVSASGSVEPQARVNLNFEGAGRVAEVRVEVGDTVEQGDVLARLDDRQAALQVEQAQAALRLAEAQLAALQVGPHPDDIAAAEANVRAAQAQVSAAAASRDQVETGPTQGQIAAAQAQVASAQLQYRLALQQHDAVVNDSAASEESKEQAHYNLYSAEKALNAAQVALDALLAGTNANQVRAAQANVAAAVAQQEAAQAQLDLLKAGVGAGQIAAAEAAVTQARIALEQAQLALENTVLHAPFDGVVAAVNVAAGEMAPLALPAFTVLDTSRLYIAVRVDEIDVGKMTRGQTAQVTLEALPGVVITGTVERIAPVADFEGGVVYYDVTIGLAPTTAPVRADMTANATIVIEELAGVLLIPTWVVRVDRDTGQTYVERRVGNGVERVDVELGVRHEGFAQVLGGLSEGDEVVWIPESAFDFGGR